MPGLKFTYGTAWEGDDRDLIQGSFLLPESLPGIESGLQISRGMGQKPH